MIASSPSFSTNRATICFVPSSWPYTMKTHRESRAATVVAALDSAAALERHPN
jgi:hypothetical protein